MKKESMVDGPIVETDPSVRSLEGFVDSLFEATSEKIKVLAAHRPLNTHWFDLRLGDRRLKLLPANHRLLLWDGTVTNVLWNGQEQRWEVVDLTKTFQGRKVEIKRASGDTTITIRPTSDTQFGMDDVISHFGNGIVRLDEVQQPLGEYERVDLDLLGGMVQIEIDQDSLAFYSAYTSDTNFDPIYCLYLKKNDPLAKGLCEPMTQLLGQFFWCVKKE